MRNTRSATKTVTGMLIGIAIDKGYIKGVDVPVMTYFADKRPLANPDPRKDKITIEDFLTMSSLLECDDENSFSRGNEERMYLVEDWAKFALDLPIKGFRGLDVQTEGFALWTGLELLHGRPHDPRPALGARHEDAGLANSPTEVSLCAARDHASLNGNIEPLGPAMTGGGLALRSRDLFKLGQLYLNGGTWNGTRIVSQPLGRRPPRRRMPMRARIPTMAICGGCKRFTPRKRISNLGACTEPAEIRSLSSRLLDAVVVVTTTNYHVRNAADLTMSC